MISTLKTRRGFLLYEEDSWLSKAVFENKYHVMGKKIVPQSTLTYHSLCTKNQYILDGMTL